MSFNIQQIQEISENIVSNRSLSSSLNEDLDQLLALFVDYLVSAIENGLLKNIIGKYDNGECHITCKDSPILLSLCQPLRLNGYTLCEGNSKIAFIIQNYRSDLIISIYHIDDDEDQLKAFLKRAQIKFIEK